MSLSSLLSIARSALLAHQRAMDVTAHNVANAQTPGYSRQRLILSAATPQITTFGTLGRGVSDTAIVRARDQFLDATYRRGSGLLGGSSTLSSFLGEVEAAVHEPSETGIAASLDGLFQSFGDLANDPTGGPNRQLVRNAAVRLVNQLHQLDQQLSSVTEDAAARMKGDVGEANQLAKQIASLNAQILSAGGSANSAPDLEDQRDLLVDRLSSLISVEVLHRDDGSISVVAGDTMLVDAANSEALEVRAQPAGGYTLGLVGGGAVDARSGSLKAMVDLTTTSLPAVRAKLDMFTKAVVTEVNLIHRTGYTPAGATNTDFFDASGITAGTIALAAPIQADANAIAAGATAAPGDGAIALQLAGLAGNGVGSLAGKSLREYYVEIASGVGLDVQGVNQDVDTQAALLDNADQRRASVSGVSIDEEMVALIGQQQAYSAAARLIKTADEMIQDLLQMI